MGDLDELYATEAPPAPKAKRAAAPAAPVAGLSDEQFQALKADPSRIGPISKQGFSPAQEADFRAAWPMSNQPSQTVSNKSLAAQVGALDRLGTAGEEVFALPKIDQRAREAVEGHYTYLRGAKHEKPVEGLGALVDKILPADHDPIDKLKGPAKAQAVAMRDLIDHMKGAKDFGGAGNADELALLTSMLPAPGDKPAEVARKRVAFANELEELAQGLPPQNWRNAARHIVRARKLRGAEETAKPTAGAKAPQAAGEAPAEGSGLGWLKRAVVDGATGLSLPVLAGLKTALDETPEEHQQGQAMMMPPGMAEAVGVPPQPTSIPRGPSFSEEAAGLQDTKARNLGFPDSAALAAQEEIDRQEHPYVARGVNIASGIADPANIIFGMPAAAFKGLSPVARAALAHALPAGAAGGMAAAGKGADAAGIAKAAGLSALIGTALGKGAEHLLASPARNEMIAKVAADEGKALKQIPSEIAARRAELEKDVFANPEATAVSLKNKHAQHEIGPKLEEWKRTLLAKHNVVPGSKLDKSLNALEDAIESGDIHTAAELRKQWDQAWANSPNARPESGAPKKDIDALLNIRAVKVAAEGGGGHGPVSNVGANAHPFQTLSNADAGAGAKATAMLHAAGEGMGDRGLKALVAGAVRKPLGAASDAVNGHLARLYLARQAGNPQAIQDAAAQALRAGASFQLVSQIAGSVDGTGEK